MVQAQGQVEISTHTGDKLVMAVQANLKTLLMVGMAEIVILVVVLKELTVITQPQQALLLLLPVLVLGVRPQKTLLPMQQAVLVLMVSSLFMNMRKGLT